MLLGVIADDLTGATDVALMLSRNGMRTVQVIGVPTPDQSFGDADAVVVALKSRTIPVREAIEMSLDSAGALLAAGAEQYLFKYCSTFDSTDAGNIGPVAEALVEVLAADFTIVCPAFPANGRSVYLGHLFVGQTLLSDSPMKDHPLTPMHDSNLVRVLERQVKGKVGLIPFATVARGAAAIRASLDAARAEGLRFLVVDAVSDEHLRAIGAACAGLRVLTGGSGIAMGLPDNFRAAGKLAPHAPRDTFEAPPGKSVILAGSCSQATREQIRVAIEAGTPAFRIDPVAAEENAFSALDVADWADENAGGLPPLVYSSGDPAEVRRVQEKLGAERAADLIESLFYEIAGSLHAEGFTRFLVAGGETSGAVVDGIGVSALEIGPEIDPGVPWTRSVGDRDVALALKSGNFGAPDFFLKAWKMVR